MHTTSARASVTMLLGFLAVASGAYAQCEKGKLKGDDSAAGDLAGVAVANDGDVAVVGAIGADTTGGVDAGAAYVFRRVNGAWVQEAKLTAPDGAAGDNFGSRVGVSGNTIVVAAEKDDTSAGVDTGSAYVFAFQGGAWVSTQRLTPPGAAPGDTVTGVAVDGTLLAVASSLADPGGRTDAGVIDVYRFNGTTWAHEVRLTPAESAAGDQLRSVAVRAGRILGGAWLADTAGGADAGEAYIWRLDGQQWVQTATLTASNGAAGDIFGYNVALDDLTAVVGGCFHDEAGASNAGAAYTYTSTDGVAWSAGVPITAPNPVAGDLFGVAVAVRGNAAVIGARGRDGGRGAGFLYRRSGNSWTLVGPFVGSDSAPGDAFGGNSVSMTDSVVIAGAYLDDDKGNESGTAFAFDPRDCCRADFDGNGTVDSDDFFDFVNAFLEEDLRADYDGSGTVDSDDFFDYLNDFIFSCS